MTFTWDASLLGTSALQQVRATIGDTDSLRALLTDEQINWRLGLYDDEVVPSSIACIKDIIAKLARDVDRNNVGMGSQRSQQIQHYKDLLKELVGENVGLASPYLGGISDSAEDAINSNSDYRQMPVKIGWGNNSTDRGTDDEDE